MKKLTFLLLLVLFVSCKKEDDNLFPDTKIEGVVLDRDTGKPIESVEVAVYKKGSTSMVWSIEDRKLKSCKTNEKGEYLLKIDALEEGDYFMKITDDFYCEDSTLEVEKFVKNNFQHTLLERSALQISLKDSFPQITENVSFKFPHWTNEFESCSYIQGSSSYYSGTITDTKKYFVKGNQMVHYKLEVTRNGIIKSIEDSVFCKIGELTKKEIMY